MRGGGKRTLEVPLKFIGYGKLKFDEANKAVARKRAVWATNFTQKLGGIRVC